jgi:uncharacterized membrane protein
LTPLSILLVLVSALLHSSWNFFAKRGNWPGEFFFWVFLWGVLLYLPFFFAFGVFPSFLFQAPSKLWWIVILSGFLESVYIISLIQAYRVGDFSLVYPISRSAPLFTQFWAIALIGEVLSMEGVLGIVLVVMGIFVISLKDFHLKNMIPKTNRFISRPYVLALVAAMANSIYSVIDKVGVQIIHPVFYIWFINLWMSLFIGLYLFLRRKVFLMKAWQESKKEILIITILQNVAYILVLMALTMSKVSYVVAFRQVSALFGAGMGILLLKESQWKTRMTGALILTMGLILIGLAK